MSVAAGRIGTAPPGLAALIGRAGMPAPDRPVEKWNPPYCGEIDIRIAADGTWTYGGTPIGREALVRLFASILRCEADGRHVLVTPVERLGIRVDDAPFLAVEIHVDQRGVDQQLTFRTNVGDVVSAGAGNPVRFALQAGTGGLKPYVKVRGRLEALATRSVALELAALATEKGGRSGIMSGGAFFPFPDGADG